MSEIKLFNNRGFEWFSNDKASVKGYAFDSKDNYLSGQKLLDFFSFIEDEKKFAFQLSNLSGFFSVIVEGNNFTLAAVDRMRAFPIFYSYQNKLLKISDNPDWLDTGGDNNNISSLVKDEFLLCGYVTGRDTLLDSIKQLQAGEYLVFNKHNSNICQKRYFEYLRQDDNTINNEDLLKAMDNLHVKVFKRMIKSLNNRTALIPLSGGHDSRLLVFMLKRLGYENVICYTYGKKGNWESEISKKVALSLGYKWHFVPFTRKKWYDWFTTQSRKDYFKFGGHIASIAHIQDWPAVKELQDKNLIPEDAIFVPGHSYDFLQGGHLDPHLLNKPIYSNKEVQNLIIQKHYNLWDKISIDRKQSIFSERINRLIVVKESYSSEEAAEQFEKWDWQERQAKFICNSVRVYEFWNFAWRMPFWDNDLMKFWSKIPLKHRIRRNLYFRYAKKYVDIDVPANPARMHPKLLRFENYFDVWYGRYNGNRPLPATWLDSCDTIANVESQVLNLNKKVYRTNKNGLNTLYRMSEILGINDPDNF